MIQKLFTGFVKLTGWPAQFCCFRTKVYYEDKAVQSRHIKGPAIIICNHTSVFDFAVLMFVFFTRQLHTMMAELLFDHKFPPFFLKWLGGIYVDRNSFEFGFLGEALDILKKGGTVLVFPESRIPRKEESRPLPFKSLVAYMAHESGVPVIPCYTNGSYFVKKRARVIIGKPIDVASLWNSDKSEKENLEAVTLQLRERVIRLGKLLSERIEQGRLTKPGYYFWYDFAKVTGALPMLLWYRPKFIYENAAARKRLKGAVIFSSNHVSLDDPIVLMVAQWHRRIHILAMKELFDQKGTGWILRKFHAISVDRKNFRFSSFREVEQQLSLSRAVGLFPEGGVNVDQTTVSPFHAGVVLMAAKGNAPIQPVYIRRRMSIWKRQVIVIGEPIDIRGTYGPMPDMKTMNDICALLRAKELQLMNLS